MKKLKITILLVLLNIFVLNLFLPVAGAATLDDARIQELKKSLDEKISNDPVSSCKQTLFERYDLEVAEFLQFLDANFQNKSANSSLTNIAISRFVEYKQAVDNTFQKIVPGAGTAAAVVGLNTEELSAYLDCSKIRDAYINLAKEQMIEHIKNTTAEKKATILVEKYRAINDKLRDLNVNIARMYGYFVTFKDKLPFFVKNCITIP